MTEQLIKLGFYIMMLGIFILCGLVVWIFVSS